MSKSDTPKGQDSTSKDTTEGKNGGAIGETVPVNPKVPTAENKTRDANNHPSKMITWIKNQITLTVIIEILGFLLLVRIACIYSGQLTQMVESNKINRESLESVQRAFIFVNPVPEIQTANTGSSQLTLFNFWMENAGVTPTKKLSAHISWVRSYNGTPLPRDFAFPDAGTDSQDSSVSVIGPKNKFPLSVGPIPRDFMERLYKHEVRLFTYGWVKYNDVFENTPRHVIRFSYELVAVQGVVHLQNGQEGQGLQTVVNGPRFNCYDEECDEQEHQ
jgi:hypothetical protein